MNTFFQTLRNAAFVLAAFTGASLHATSSNTIVIDSFDLAWDSVTQGTAPTLLRTATGFPHAGNMQFGLTTSSTILGGQRVGMVQDGHSGSISPGLVAISISEGSASLYGNASAPVQYFYYGSGIDRDGNSPGTPVNWNLNLTPAATLDYTIEQIAVYETVAQNTNITFSFQTGAGNVNYSVIGATSGHHSISLITAGLNEAQAGSIQGLVVSFTTRGDSAAAGTRLGNLQFTTSAIPEPSSFAALAGLAVLGLVATRRHRAV